MREELQNVYPFVKKWMLAQGCDFEMPTKTGEVIWSTDYIEYRLHVTFFNMPQLMAENIEMTNDMIWNLPVPDNEAQFLALMDVLNNPDWSPRSEVDALVSRGELLTNNEFAKRHAGQPNG